MLTALLATLTAALFGVSDFLGGLAARRASAFVVTSTSHSVGLLVLGAATLIMLPEAVTPTDIAWGAVAGVSGGLGVVALYAALACGRMSVVAPVTAAISGSLPALFDVARGSALSVLDVIGLALAAVAVVLVSATSPHPASREAMSRRALVLACAAGLGFAGSWLSFAQTAPASGFAPLVSARAVSGILVGALAYSRVREVIASGPARPKAVGAGALDAFANVAMISAIHIGPLAVASVLGSLYPVTTVLLARAILNERVSPLQAVGVSLALVAVVLTALP